MENKQIDEGLFWPLFFLVRLHSSSTYVIMAQLIFKKIKNCPTQGNLCYHFGPLLQNQRLLKSVIQQMVEHYAHTSITHVVSLSQLGIVLGTLMAQALNVAHVVVTCQQDELPPPPILTQTYASSHGPKIYTLHAQDLPPKARVLIINDILSTSESAVASIELMNSAEATVVGLAFMLEFTSMQTRSVIERLIPSVIVFAPFHINEHDEMTCTDTVVVNSDVLNNVHTMIDHHKNPNSPKLNDTNNKHHADEFVFQSLVTNSQTHDDDDGDDGNNNDENDNHDDENDDSLESTITLEPSVRDAFIACLDQSELISHFIRNHRKSILALLAYFQNIDIGYRALLYKAWPFKLNAYISEHDQEEKAWDALFVKCWKRYPAPQEHLAAILDTMMDQHQLDPTWCIVDDTCFKVILQSNMIELMDCDFTFMPPSLVTSLVDLMSDHFYALELEREQLDQIRREKIALNKKQKKKNPPRSTREIIHDKVENTQGKIYDYIIKWIIIVARSQARYRADELDNVLIFLFDRVNLNFNMMYDMCGWYKIVNQQVVWPEFQRGRERLLHAETKRLEHVYWGNPSDIQ